MTTYQITGYFGGDFLINEGASSTVDVGSHLRLRSDWDASRDVRHFAFTDDDSMIHGDILLTDIGVDFTQSLSVTDAAGTPVLSGTAYIEYGMTLSAPDGSAIQMYVLEINGTIVGEITTRPLVPGVTYCVTSVYDVLDPNDPAYSAIAGANFDPDLVNVMQGGSLADSIASGAGNDTVMAGAGADHVDGGTGDDTLYYGTGGSSSLQGDTVHGGEGNDVIDDASGVAWVYNDSLYGDAGNDTIWAGGGNDMVDGGADNDLILGEAGDDTLRGGTGNDTLDGGEGADSLLGEAGNDVLSGGGGNDTLLGGDGADTLTGGGGNDSLLGGADADTVVLVDGWGNDTVDGGAAAGTTGDSDRLDFSSVTSGVTVTLTGSEAGTASAGTGTLTFSEIEQITGSAMGDSIDARAGAAGMTLDGGAGADTILGGAGADSILGGSGTDLIDGGSGNDTIFFGAGDDTVLGGEGNDSIDDAPGVVGDAYASLLDGGAGDDTIFAGGGNDTLLGGAGADRLFGEGGDDLLSGGLGADALEGGAGRDRLEGGAGDDMLTGGAGADTLVFANGSGADTIADFDLTDDGTGLTLDRLDLSGLTDAQGNPVNAWDIVIGADAEGNAVLGFPGGESITLRGIAPDTLGASRLHAMGIPCFVAGTLVSTPAGPRPVETLRRGDLVSLAGGGALPLIWAGGRCIPAQEAAAAPRLRPVEFAPGTLGNRRALRLSPAHAVWLPEGGGVLVPAGRLARSGLPGVGAIVPEGPVVYHHLLLPRHALLLAEGARVESFWPGPIGFSALDGAARHALLAAAPELAPGLLGQIAVSKVYGPPAAPRLAPGRITRRSFSNWSSALREMTHSDGPANETSSPARRTGELGFFP